jgi:cytochrome P450
MLTVSEPLIKASKDADGQMNEKNGETIPAAPGGLSRSEIIGNAFVFMFAGHETAANTLQFCTLMLAMNLPSQIHMQEDIDRIVGKRPSSTWTYENDMGSLQNSMIGAVMNEELRLMPPVTAPPKVVTHASSQTLNLDNKVLTLQPNTLIHINTVGSGRNPKYFPHSPSKISGLPHDLDDFVPERWLVSQSRSDASPPSLFKPVKGAFVPFSDGARACPGKRFAQVEIVAVLSVLFQNFSVELDVSTFASDVDVAKMDFEERKAVYEKARCRAQKLMKESIHVITLKMRGDAVPVRFMKRGKERFRGC